MLLRTELGGQLGRVEYVVEDDAAVLDAFSKHQRFNNSTSRLSAITTALLGPSRRASACARRWGVAWRRHLSGRGDKDVDYVAEVIGMTGDADRTVN